MRRGLVGLVLLAGCLATPAEARPNSPQCLRWRSLLVRCERTAIARHRPASQVCYDLFRVGRRAGCL